MTRAHRRGRITGPNLRSKTSRLSNCGGRSRRERDLTFIPPQLAAKLTSTDYRANNDPALKVILSYSSKKELPEQLTEALAAGDLALAAKRFREFRTDPVNAYLNAEAIMNTFGYQLMRANHLDQAIEIFKLNTEAYPQSANIYDSLGEAYMNKGNKELAIKNYQKAFELDPTNTNAMATIKRLSGQ